jgi:hypothetical protein
MAITVELAFGHIITVDHDTATIGRAPGSDILVADSPKIQPVHAKIMKVANRWMIESAGDWLLQVGDGVPGRKLWLNPGDVVHLAESGPYMVFAPKPNTPKAAVPQAELDTPLFSSTFLQAISTVVDKQDSSTPIKEQKSPAPVKEQESPAPAMKPKKPEAPRKLDEDEEIWEEVYGYWSDDIAKKGHPPKSPPHGRPPTPPHK